jgi:hypothetical protein
MINIVTLRYELMDSLQESDFPALHNNYLEGLI